MPKISIVVIIYKIEQYLKQCLESILAQTYSDFELILVDDGSPDNCPHICDEYAKKDNRIKVIHQKNQGAVTARWNGILASTGEYISLIDGDDWLELNMYEEMIKLINENGADVVVVGYKEGMESNYKTKGNALESGFYKGCSMQKIYSHMLYTGKFYEPGIIAALWNKLIKRELFFKDYIPPSPIIRLGEDAAVSYPMIARANSIVINNEICPYYYRVVQGSMSRSLDERYFDRCLELFDSLLMNLQLNNEIKYQLKYYTLFIIKLGITQLCSRQSRTSILKQKRVLDNFYKRYVNLGIDTTYDWSILEDCKWIQPFFKGDIKGTIIKLYKEKILKKATNVLLFLKNVVEKR